MVHAESYKGREANQIIWDSLIFFKRGKKQQNETGSGSSESQGAHNSFIKVKPSKENKKLMSSMAEVTEEKGDLEKALHYYKLAEDETNSRRLEKIVEDIKKEELKRKHNLLISRAENDEKKTAIILAL